MPKEVLVTPAQVDAAKAVVRRRTETGRPVAEAVKRIAEAGPVPVAQAGVAEGGLGGSPSQIFEGRPLALAQVPRLDDKREMETTEHDQELTAGSKKRRYTIFISHSSSDRAIAEQLRRSLESLDLFVWAEQSDIRIGESLSAQINSGFTNANMAVVLLTPSFFSSPFLKYQEIAEVLNRRTVIPVLYNVPLEAVGVWQNFHPLETSGQTFEGIAEKIAAAVIARNRVS